MSITPKFKTSKEAKAAGFFSRRHATNKEHLEAHAKMEAKKLRKQERARGLSS